MSTRLAGERVQIERRNESSSLAAHRRISGTGASVLDVQIDQKTRSGSHMIILSSLKCFCIINDGRMIDESDSA